MNFLCIRRYNSQKEIRIGATQGIAYRKTTNGSNSFDRQNRTTQDKRTETSNNIIRH